MITKNDDLLGTLIHDVAHLLRLDIDARLEGHNLTRVKWLALGILHHKGALTQSELAQEMELGTASVGRLVDRLVEREFVKRQQDKEDRRAYRLHLTESALALLKDLENVGTKLRQETLQSLTQKDVKALNTGLLKIKSNLQAQAAAICLAAYVFAQKIASSHSNIATDVISFV